MGNLLSPDRGSLDSRVPALLPPWARAGHHCTFVIGTKRPHGRRSSPWWGILGETPSMSPDDQARVVHTGALKRSHRRQPDSFLSPTPFGSAARRYIRGRQYARISGKRLRAVGRCNAAQASFHSDLFGSWRPEMIAIVFTTELVASQHRAATR